MVASVCVFFLFISKSQLTDHVARSIPLVMVGWVAPILGCEPSLILGLSQNPGVLQGLPLPLRQCTARPCA